MGQEIFYCVTCKTLLRTRDIEKGAALRSEDKVFCKACAEASGVQPPPPVTPRLSSDARLSSSRTPKQGTTPAPPAKNSSLIVGGVLAGLALLILIGALASGGSKPPPRREEPEPAPPPRPAVVETPVTPPRVVETLPPKPVDREPSARKLLEEAKAFYATSPDDLDGAFEKARRALFEAADTPVEADARRLDEEIRAKLKDRAEKKWAAIDARVKAALAAEKFGEAMGTLDAEKVPDAPAKAAEIRLAADKLWAELKEKLYAARKKGAQADAKAIAARVEGWGVDALRQELQALLASPVEVDPSPEILAWRKRLSELAPPLDWASVVKELEKLPNADKADLDALRLAAEVQKEIPLVLPKLKPGTELKIERPEGPVSGRVTRVTANEVELLSGEERVSVASVDISPWGWCELVKAKPRAAQVYCALEGEARPGEPLPPNIVALGERLSKEAKTPAETAARQLFADAERDFSTPVLRLAAGAKYASIPKETAFARRAKGLIDERIAASQEVFISVDEMTIAGQFVPSEAIKGTSTLTMVADGRGTESYAQVEAHFTESSKAWVYAAACCLEMFGIAAQAPELTGPNPKDPKEQVSFAPGAPHAMPIKGSSIGMKSKHNHNGRELKWVWAPIPLPKSAAGSRKLRIVGEREGLSVAWLWLSASKPGPPRDADLKEAERAKPQLETRTGPPTGTLLREFWNGPIGDKIQELTSAPGFPDKPTGSTTISIFEGPSDVADNYGTRVRGYVLPPANGNYVFFLSSDDQGELWLSLDESPLRKRRIAQVVGSSSRRGWEDAGPAAKSEPIPLKAGKRYYVELLHKEGQGNDHFAVGWQLPDGTMERPIPGNRLSAWTGTARASNKPGFYRAINLGGPALTIDGQAWEAQQGAPDFWTDAGGFDNQIVPLEPPLEGPKAKMIRDSVFRREGVTVALGNVPAGRYQVFCFIWEDNSNQIFDILLNTRVVKERHNSGGPGHWERLGPWTVDVTDGRIELRCGAGDANISGIEVWRVR